VFSKIHRHHLGHYFPILVLATTCTGLLGTIIFPHNAVYVAIGTFIAIVAIIITGPAQEFREKIASFRIMRGKASKIPKQNIPFSLIAIFTTIPLISSLSWITLAATVIPLGLYLAPFALDAIFDILFFRRLRREAKEAFTALSPQLILYLSGPEDTFYQVNQWIPVLERLELKCAIVLRNAPVFRQMSATEIPVFFIRTSRDLEWAYSQGPRIVLYPNNREKNVNSLRHSGLTHIFINHGESDKSVNQSKMLMAYDHLFVGGRLAEERLSEAELPLRPQQVVHVGRPQAELALEYRHQTNKIKRILYAPTWEGGISATSYSSVNSVGLSLLQQLADSKQYEIRIKPHPLTGTSQPSAAAALAKMRNMPAVDFYDASSSIHDLMNWSDIIICDVSAVLNEYLVTGKPIVLCNILGKDLCLEELSRAYPSSKAAYVLQPAGSIIDILEEIESGDPLLDERRETRLHSMGEGGALQRFESALLKCLSNA